MATPPANIHFINTDLPPGFAVRRLGSIKATGNSVEDVLLNLRTQAGVVPEANWIINLSLTRESAADRSLSLWTGEAIAAALTLLE